MFERFQTNQHNRTDDQPRAKSCILFVPEKRKAYNFPCNLSIRLYRGARRKRRLSALQLGGGGAVGETLLAGVDEVGAQLFLDSEELVVLGNSLGSTGSTSLDETGLEGDGQVRDVDGLGLTGSVRGHDTPVARLSELNAERGVRTLAVT